VERIFRATNYLFFMSAQVRRAKIRRLFLRWRLAGSDVPLIRGFLSAILKGAQEERADPRK
jgi:hypothetical protein